MVKLRAFAIIPILMAIVSTIFLGWAIWSADEYDVEIGSDYEEIFYELNSSLAKGHAEAESLESKTHDIAESSTSVFGFTKIKDLLLVPITSLQSGIQQIKLMNTLLHKGLHVPTWIISAVESILIITIAWLVISAFRGRNI